MLAIAGGKGGCGKTTTAVSLARALARDGREPLVAEADLDMPDLHLGAGVPRQPGLAAVAAGRPPIEVAHADPVRPAARILPGTGLDATDAIATFRRLRDRSGPVLLDCPAGAGRDVGRALRVADGALLVSTPTPKSLRDTVKTAAMAGELGAPPVGVVLVETTPAHAPDCDGPCVSTRDARQLFRTEIFCRVPYKSSADSGENPIRTAYLRVARKVQERNI